MDLGENPTLTEEVESDNELKTWLVNYVGKKAQPETGEVTVSNIVDVMAKEFPEFLMAVAEENWIRGYHQALNDSEHGLIEEYRSQLMDKAKEECETCTGECGECE